MVGIHGRREYLRPCCNSLPHPSNTDIRVPKLINNKIRNVTTKIHFFFFYLLLKVRTTDKKSIQCLLKVFIFSTNRHNPSNTSAPFPPLKFLPYHPHGQMSEHSPALTCFWEAHCRGQVGVCLPFQNLI